MGAPCAACQGIEGVEVQLHLLDVLEPHEHLLERAVLAEHARDGLLADLEFRHLDSGKPEAITWGKTPRVNTMPGINAMIAPVLRFEDMCGRMSSEKIKSASDGRREVVVVPSQHVRQ